MHVILDLVLYTNAALHSALLLTVPSLALFCWLFVLVANSDQTNEVNTFLPAAFLSFAWYACPALTLVPTLQDTGLVLLVVPRLLE